MAWINHFGSGGVHSAAPSKSNPYYEVAETADIRAPKKNNPPWYTKGHIYLDKLGGKRKSMKNGNHSHVCCICKETFACAAVTHCRVDEALACCYKQACRDDYESVPEEA